MRVNRFLWTTAVIAALLLMYGVPFTLMNFNNGNEGFYISGLIASGIGLALVLMGLILSAIQKDREGYEPGQGLKKQLRGVYGAISAISLCVGFPLAFVNISKEPRLFYFGLILGSVGAGLLLLDTLILIIKNRSNKYD